MSHQTPSLLNLLLLGIAMLLTANTAEAARQCMSADDFSAMCIETMKSDETTADDQLMSQREFSRFLNSLPCLFIESPSNAKEKDCSRSEFYNLPFNIRFYFVKKVCKQIDDPDVEEDDCQNNLADNKLSPEKFGFVSTKQSFGENVDELCGGLYDLLGDEFIPAKACPGDTTNAGDTFDDGKDELRTTDGGTEESNQLNPGIFIGIGLGLLLLLVLILLCLAWRRRKSKEIKDDGAITSPADIEKDPQDLEASGVGAGAGTGPDDAMTKASSDGAVGSSGAIDIQRTETIDSASTAGGGASPPRAQDAPTPAGRE